LGDVCWWVLNPIAYFLESEADEQFVNEINQKTQHTSECGFLPFITERLFSTFLSSNPQIKCAHISRKNIDQFFTHPSEKRAVEVGREIISKDIPDTIRKNQMKRLGKITIAIGKKYFLENTHPHI